MIMTTFSTPLGGIDAQLAETGAALKTLEAPATEAADAIDAAFAKAGDSLARSLAKAASDGKVSLKELAGAVLAAVDQAAGVSPASGSLSRVLEQVLGGGFSGARADGGPVLPGGAYLVGERGPEVFRPQTVGDVSGFGGGTAQTVNVTLNVSGGADGLVRSEAQLASALNRAARMGLR
jgi:hypothetical protein